jgi:hypothetical protein
MYFELGVRFAGHWWPMPVILALREAEIRKIPVPGQQGQKSLQDLISVEQMLGMPIIPATAGSLK